MDLMEIYSRSAWRVSWDALDGLAWRALNFSSLHSPRLDRDGPYRCIPRLRLTDDPGGNSPEFNPLTLTVFRLYPYDGRALAVREAVWRRADDLDRVRNAIEQTLSAVALEPTVEVRDGPVLADRISDLLHEANRYRLPVTWFSDTESISSSCGSSTFEFFSLDDPPAILHLGWGWETPEEWQAVIDWIGRLRQFLNGCLDPPDVQKSTALEPPQQHSS